MNVLYTLHSIIGTAIYVCMLYIFFHAVLQCCLLTLEEARRKRGREEERSKEVGTVTIYIICRDMCP